ncbi:MAG: sugar phosphate nucleotidyltransferase [Myxococcota bacterium]|nr:sugar phosphate nucleotidyltransferase [Myxococcota bacterium]
MSEHTLCGLIIAGGRGKRFWPRSRLDRPKQCMDMGGGKSLLQMTVERQAGLIPRERLFVVTAAEVADAVRENLGDWPEENLLIEPVGRNTAACVVWGTMEIQRRVQSDNLVVAVMPADHKIEDGAAFRRSLSDCALAASSTQAIVTIGIEPTRPETAFGYIRPGDAEGEWGARTFRVVQEFVEKPNQATAEQWLAEGGRLWNAGLFVFTPESLMGACKTHLRDTWDAVERLREEPEALEAVYPSLEPISLDHGILERASRVLSTPATFDWSDMGTWVAVAKEFPLSEGGRARARRVVAVDSEDCVVDAPGKVVALLGVKGLVVVETDDSLLVCTAERAGEIGVVVENLEGSPEEDVI